MPCTLSKSDYKAARTCPTMLYYREQGYPSTKDDNPYLKLLRAGGYMVGKMARLLYPAGQELQYDGGSEESVRATLEALSAESVTLFDATFLSGGKLARVHILERRGNVFNLIEVKSKLYSTREALERTTNGLPNPLRGKKGAISSDWRKHLEDVTFLVIVLRELFPTSTVRPFLALVDKDKTSSLDAIHRFFQITRVPMEGKRISKIVVDFTGDPDKLRADHLLTIVDVAGEVEELFEDVRVKAAEYAATLQPELRKIDTPISVDCRECDYRVDATQEPSGFRECWGPLSAVEPSLLDLYYVGTIGPRNDPLANRLIRQGKCSLYDVPTELLVKRDGTVGAYNSRQLIQIEHTRAGTTWMSDELAEFVGAQRYPLHFIDFETSALAIPYHAGMRPYETVAFQWSCHTISSPGAEPVHAEWINNTDYFPNVEFARTLRDCIGTDGTVFMWAPHEQTVLRGIVDQMERYGSFDRALAEWLIFVAGSKGGDKGRLVDLNDKTLDGFFHPAMEGRTSIKWVLAAIWGADPEVRRKFSRYERYDGGRLLDPYDALPPIEIAGSRIDSGVVVTEGTEAIWAYQEMLYGESRGNAAACAAYRQLLLQYCELDTAAMVMIWNHWTRMAAQGVARAQ
jgi:hypothetical protein